jgi:hypothetical protein
MGAPELEIAAAKHLRSMKRRSAPALLGLLMSAFAGHAAGQAWVPDKGEGSVSTAFNYISFKGHFTSDGDKTPEAGAKAQSVLFDLDYGITNKLALTVSVPIVAARYADTNPPSPVLLGLFNQAVRTVGAGFYGHGFLDDERYHPTLQDINLNVRYNVLSRPLVVTPFIALVVPSHDYAYVGEAAPGRNLWEFQFGTSLGRQLDPVLPNAYAHTQISFAVPQESLNVRTTRTNISLEFGYALTRKFSARGLSNWQHTFNGLHFPADLTTPELVLTHERLLKANYWHLGGGISFAVTPKTEVSADVVTFLTGSDTHYGTGLSIRITRSFKWKSLALGHRSNSSFRPSL